MPDESTPNLLFKYAFPQTYRIQSRISCLIVVLDSIIRIKLKPDPGDIIRTVESAMTPWQQSISTISITRWHSWCRGLTIIQFPFLSCNISLGLYYRALFFSCEPTTNLKHFNYVNCASDNSFNQHSSARSHVKDEIMLIIFMSTLISNWMNTRDRKAAFIRNMNYGSHIT